MHNKNIGIPNMRENTGQKSIKNFFKKNKKVLVPVASVFVVLVVGILSQTADFPRL